MTRRSLSQTAGEIDFIYTLNNSAILTQEFLAAIGDFNREVYSGYRKNLPKKTIQELYQKTRIVNENISAAERIKLRLNAAVINQELIIQTDIEIHSSHTTDQTIEL